MRLVGDGNVPFDGYISIRASVRDAICFFKIINAIVFISIRASVRDAIERADQHVQNLENFNPRIREGCDEKALAFSLALGNFNPRIREGCDSSFYIGSTRFYELNS